MAAVISVDGYPFLAFSDLTCHLENMGIGVFCCTVPPAETKLGSSDQEPSPSAGINTRVVLVLVSCLRMEVRPDSYFWWCVYF